MFIKKENQTLELNVAQHVAHAESLWLASMECSAQFADLSICADWGRIGCLEKGSKDQVAANTNTHLLLHFNLAILSSSVRSWDKTHHLGKQTEGRET